MQTILGSGGGIGTPLAKELNKYTNHIRLVSRHPKKVNESDELFPLDVTDSNQINKAIAGSEIVYVVIGFEYKLTVWQKVWPTFMKEVILACRMHNSKLVFFDNVYLYATSSVPHMTENSLIQPPSKKGEVRKIIHDMVFTEVGKNNLKALVARSADFYGPDNKSSALTLMVAENLIKGKKAQVFGDPNKIHTYTYTPDAALATAILGNTDDAYNQVWHVPTTKQRLTNLQWIQLIADELSTNVKIQKIPAWMLHILGIFIPIMKEFPEMLYQYEQDYIFDSTRFENRFGIKATLPEEGIKALIKSLKSSLDSR